MSNKLFPVCTNDKYQLYQVTIDDESLNLYLEAYKEKYSKIEKSVIYQQTPLDQTGYPVRLNPYRYAETGKVLACQIVNVTGNGKIGGPKDADVIADIMHFPGLYLSFKKAIRYDYINLTQIFNTIAEIAGNTKMMVPEQTKKLEMPIYGTGIQKKETKITEKKLKQTIEEIMACLSVEIIDEQELIDGKSIKVDSDLSQKELVDVQNSVKTGKTNYKILNSSFMKKIFPEPESIIKQKKL